MTKTQVLTISTLILFSLTLSACGKATPKAKFSSDSDIQAFPTLSDTAAKVKINSTKQFKLNQAVPVVYKTTEGQGTVEYKAKKMTEVASIDGRLPEDGKKLVLLEFSYKGSAKNKGQPSTVNQIGDTPAPQFVLVDKNKNESFVEETVYSDAYAASKKLFELYKLTLDNEKVVDTALVFQVDKALPLNLAVRFTNLEGKTEFYDVQ